MADINESAQREQFDLGNTLVKIGLVCVAIMPLILAIQLLFPRSGKLAAPQSACINNLRQIDGAKEAWRLETHAPSNATPTWTSIQPYMGQAHQAMPKCPSGGAYIIGSVQVIPTCSISNHVLEPDN